MNQQASEPILIYSAAWCGDCKRAKRFLDSQRVPYITIDIEQDAAALALVEPSNAELAAKLRR